MIKIGDILYVLIHEDIYYIHEMVIDKITDDKLYCGKFCDHVSIYKMLFCLDDIGNLVFKSRYELFKKVQGEYVEYSKNGCPVVKINGELMEMRFN